MLNVRFLPSILSAQHKRRTKSALALPHNMIPHSNEPTPTGRGDEQRNRAVDTTRTFPPPGGEWYCHRLVIDAVGIFVACPNYTNGSSVCSTYCSMLTLYLRFSVRSTFGSIDVRIRPRWWGELRHAFCALSRRRRSCDCIWDLFRTVAGIVSSVEEYCDCVFDVMLGTFYWFAF